MRRQQIRHAADFAPAHRVGLAGERQRAGARFADLRGREMQVDQRSVVVRAVRRLVQPLAIHRQRRARCAEPLRRLHDVSGRHAADGGRGLRRVFAHRVFQRVEAGGVGADVIDIAQALPQHHVQHRVVQRYVGAGQYGQKQVGGRRGIRAPRIDDDEPQRRIARFRIFEAAEQYRMRERGVRAGDEYALGVVDVLVARGRRIRAERRLVAGDRR